MPKTHTDSSIIEHHEDGSWTETTTVTHLPATRSEKIVAGSLLGALFVAPFIPIVAMVASEKLEERRERRQQEKNLKSVD